VSVRVYPIDTKQNKAFYVSLGLKRDPIENSRWGIDPIEIKLRARAKTHREN
jgi:hypothetical protein